MADSSRVIVGVVCAPAVAALIGDSAGKEEMSGIRHCKLFWEEAWVAGR